MIKVLKEHIWFHYLLTKNLTVHFDSFVIEYIPQEVLNKIKDKSITHNIFRIQDTESIMCGFYCTPFIEYALSGKTLLDYTNLFSPYDYKKNDKIIYISILKTNVVEKSSLGFRLRKTDETRNYLLDEIKHNDLMSEKYKKTCKHLNYVENLLILASTINSCVSISAFALLVNINVGVLQVHQ